jgi:hypothetical protein
MPGGLVLNNGKIKKDPVLAATGAEAHFARTLDNNSAILLPPLEHLESQQKYEGMTKEVME